MRRAGSEQLVEQGRDGHATGGQHEGIAPLATVAAHGRDLVHGVHGHDEQDHGDDRAAEGFDDVQDAGIEPAGQPEGHEEEQGDAGTHAARGGRGFGVGGHLDQDAVQAFAGAQIVAEEGAADGQEGDERAEPGDEGIVELVGQIGENGDVLGLGLHQLGGAEAEHAAEDEGHDEEHQDTGRAAQGLGGLLFGHVAVMAALGQGKGRDGGRMVEGEDQHRQGEPEGAQEAAGIRHLAQRGGVPVRDEVERQAEEDAAQGVEAQTLANVYLALDHDLDVVPVLNKIDLPSADPERVIEEIEDVIGIEAHDAPRISAKTGLNIDQVLEQIVEKIPAPTGDPDAPLKALIFDALYDSYKGVIVFCRVKEGTVKVGDKIKMMATGAMDEVTEVGYFGAGQFIPCDELSAGMVGYICASIKNVRDTRVGDTVTNADRPCAEALPGYKKVNPMVYCGLYPADSAKITDQRCIFVF